MKKILILCLIICSGIKLDAQQFSEQRRQFAMTNIGINGIAGGLGALVNKNNGEKPLKVFIKGFGQGCLGGAFQVVGKELTYQIKVKENISYAWPARITSAIGNSITQNAASNINFWERGHLNLGVLRLDYQLKGNKFQARIFTSAIYGTIMSSTLGKFNLKRSLQTGIIVFEQNGLISSKHIGGPYDGYALFSAIAINKNVTGNPYYGIMAHEVMHIIQYESIAWANPFFNRFNEKLMDNSKAYLKIGRFFYLDFNGIIHGGHNTLQGSRPWECRYNEREADLFSRRIVWPRCK